MVARRGFLAGAAALAVSGCGRTATEDEPGGAPRSREATSVKGDIELLTAAIQMEQQDVLLYSRALRSLTGGARSSVQGFETIEEAHVDRLRQARADLGDRSRTIAISHDAELAGDPLRELIAAENRAIAFYLDMLPKVHDADLRTVIASILTVEAEQMVVLHRLAGLPPRSEAFVYGARA